MNDAVALILEDRGGVTVGGCQVRAAACSAQDPTDRIVVRVLLCQNDRPIQVCASCRDALMAKGT